VSEPKRYHLYAGLECQAFTKAEAVLKFSEEDDGIWVKWEDCARLKAEIEAIRQEYSDATNHYNRLHNDLEAQVEMLKGQVRYWKVEAECDHGRWLRCLEDLEKLRGQGGQP
jgi:hypothetical protein